MRSLRLLTVLPLVAAALLPVTAAAQHDDGDWVSGCDRRNHDSNRNNFCEERVSRIAAPRLLEVNGRTNGGVTVRAWDGAGVEVRQRI